MNIYSCQLMYMYLIVFKLFQRQLRRLKITKKNQQENTDEESDDSEDLVPLNQLEGKQFY